MRIARETRGAALAEAPTFRPLANVLSSAAQVRGAFTTVELAVAAAVSLMGLSLALEAYGLICHPTSRNAVPGLTERSFARKDTRLALRQMTERLREAQEILEPRPGETAAVLVFRDILGQHVRLARNAQGELATEREEAGAWKPEGRTAGLRLGGATMDLAPPIRSPGCARVSFRTLAPGCVAVAAEFLNGRQTESVRTVIGVHNAGRPF